MCNPLTIFEHFLIFFKLGAQCEKQSVWHLCFMHQCFALEGKMGRQEDYTKEFKSFEKNAV